MSSDVSSPAQDLFNRLKKKHKQLDPWAKDLKLEAYRLYHWDIPEFPFYIDRYGQYLVIWDRSEDGKDDPVLINQILQQLEQHYSALGMKVETKRRFRQAHKDEDEQYQRELKRHEPIAVRERQLEFLVNLWDYVDTGLFLDHRPLRQQLLKTANNKRVLNLFAYTGSLSVAAAAGGATCVNSVDLNPNYLEWARANFVHNKLSLNPHHFTRADVMDWLQGPVETEQDLYDIIILDPPTFSNSKRTPNVLDIERDHAYLIEGCLARLTNDGVLYFSTNKRHFKFDRLLQEREDLKWRDETNWSIPKDFDGVRPHRLWSCQKSSPLQD